MEESAARVTCRDATEHERKLETFWCQPNEYNSNQRHSVGGGAGGGVYGIQKDAEEVDVGQEGESNEDVQRCGNKAKRDSHVNAIGGLGLSSGMEIFNTEK